MGGGRGGVLSSESRSYAFPSWPKRILGNAIGIFVLRK
jgi:hypothetical protein